MNVADQTILDLVREVSKISTSTDNIEQHLVTLNGKVVAQEKRIQDVTQSAKESADYIDGLKQKSNESNKTWRHVIEKAGWAVVSVLSIIIYRVVVHIEKTGSIKDIIK